MKVVKVNRKVLVEDANSNIAAQPTVKTNLNNIIQVTEEQDTHPQNSMPPQQEKRAEVPKSKLGGIKSYIICLSNLWRYICRPTNKLELDVNDSQLATVIARIKTKKSYYGTVLPEQKEHRKVLVLDLDETLIHTSFTKPPKYDYESEVLFNGHCTKIYTIKRFGLESFLFEMSKAYQIVVFTASQKLYADKVIDLIDPKKRISHRLYREHCLVINKTYYLKNLNILGRSLNDVIIVDDNNIAGLLQPDNFYRIQPFDGNEKDRQLCRLSSFLKYIHSQTDILPIREHRKCFEEMEINLSEGFIGPNCLTLQERRSLDYRKKQYNHKKTNSEVQTLVDKNKEEQSETEAETTSSEIVKRL